MIKFRTLVGAAAVAGALAAGGSAFTAANTLPDADVTKGYGSQTISGVTAQSIAYVTDATKSTITSVDLVLDGDTTAQTIQIAFNDANPATCSDAGDNVTDPLVTSYSCTVTQAVGTATKFALIAE